MRRRISEHSGTAALVISIISLVVASSGIADAARHTIVDAVTGANQAQRAVRGREKKPASSDRRKPTGSHNKESTSGDRKEPTGSHHEEPASSGKEKSASSGSGASKIDGHRIASKPYANGVLVLGTNRKFPASAIPTVKDAQDATDLDGKKLEEIEPSCPPDTANLGTWCLEASPYPLTNQDAGLNDYKWAAQTCVEAGGYLPTAAQLIGAAKRVKLESVITDNPDTATIDEDPTVGLKDQREMTATLVTTAAGSEAAGSEGVSVGSTGDPRTGEPNPVPEPANPEPSTLQYVTVYSNGTKGGFAGSQPVSEPENFRCAYNKYPGANASEES